MVFYVYVRRSTGKILCITPQSQRQIMRRASVTSKVTTHEIYILTGGASAEATTTTSVAACCIEGAGASTGAATAGSSEDGLQSSVR